MSDSRLVDMEPGGESTQYGLIQDDLLQLPFADIEVTDMSLSLYSLKALQSRLDNWGVCRFLEDDSECTTSMTDLIQGGGKHTISELSPGLGTHSPAPNNDEDFQTQKLGMGAVADSGKGNAEYIFLV
ncbi:hypothetical protein PDIDSM_8241 [Penicillium digitatum]|nr:hypothetical protein PDIDSM_8241 [Penicillium digitatum]